MNCNVCKKRIHETEIYSTFYFCYACDKTYPHERKKTEQLERVKRPSCMKVAAESHWLCKMFQEEELEREEKKEILKSIMQEHRQKELENGQKNKKAPKRYEENF